MTSVKLKPGESVVVSALRGDEHPDQGLPGSQPHPDQGLPKPEAPVDPGYGIDLGLGYVRPEHPIVLPPTPPPLPTAPVDPNWGVEAPSTPNWEIKIAWTPVTGWVVVAVPTGPHVTPSKRR